ncbi:flavin reductase [Micromonospora sp. WMMD980]|uniref:flavin reductase n=1 Tax=Micromonospora sp. WMMD980 TaxID=3016088 RepID=UPI0024176696|nr:flavin reductase [Micromonospora sp. WMMD980]MDG4800662.1 flavin reductase [Micromonospora sp. WMMD980]
MTRGRPEHVASRPTWRCRVCGIAWPCAPAKLRLLAAYREARPALLMHLATLYARAEAELPARDGTRSVDRYQRFVGWARHRGGG